jgi:hypothetical protein
MSKINADISVNTAIMAQATGSCNEKKIQFQRGKMGIFGG